MVFPVQEYIFMYFQITSAIYVAGAGAVVIGGLYWSRGTTAGAWTALLTGMTISFAGIVLRLVWPALPIPETWPDEYPINGVWMFFIAMVAAVIGYTLVSLLTVQQPHDLGKMLHRDHPEPDHPKHFQPAPPDDEPQGSTAASAAGPHTPKPPPPRAKVFDFKALSPGDRWTAIIYLSFIGAVVAVFFIVNAVCQFIDLSDAWWVGFWKIFPVVMLVSAAAMAVWFLIGGTGDIVRLRRVLTEQHTRDTDPDATTPQTLHANRPDPPSSRD